MKMKRETKNKIYDLLRSFDPEGRIALGLVSALKTEDNAEEMIRWLENSDKKSWTEDKILSVMDDITGIHPPKEWLEKRGLI